TLPWRTTSSWSRSKPRIKMVSRCGSQLTIQRTSLRRRSFISHASRTSRWDGVSASGTGAAAGTAGPAADACADVVGAPTASGFTADRSINKSARSRFVPHASDGHHDLRVLRVLLDLGPEPLPADVPQPRVSRAAGSR